MGDALELQSRVPAAADGKPVLTMILAGTRPIKPSSRLVGSTLMHGRTLGKVKEDWRNTKRTQ